MTPSGTPYSDEFRAEAIARAEEVGITAAARERGITRASINRWKREIAAGIVATREPYPAGAGRESLAERKQEASNEAWVVAREALAVVRRLIAEGKTKEAQNAALTMAITLDKSAMLERASVLEDERQAELLAGVGDAIAAALLRVFADLGIPRVEAMAGLIRHHLLPLEDPTLDPSPYPEADIARQALRDAFDSAVPPARPALSEGEPDPEDNRDGDR